ncbi:hypothetical protein EPN90_00795 [Patescibacteria group bacterium]|nr:MAG: hypothetical protein EPN90_00795 [Patescibacteria group bacterium]
MAFTRASRFLAYLVAVVPILYVPWTLFPAVFGKVPVFLMLVAALALFAAFVSHPKKTAANSARPRQFLDSAVLIFAGIYSLTALSGSDFFRSVWGTESRGTGLVVLLALVFWYFLSRRFLYESSWRRFWWIILLGASIEAAVGILESFAPRLALGFGDSGRFSAFFGNPSYLGAYLAPAFFIAPLLLSRASNRGRVVLGFLAVIIFLGIILTGSRGAFLGLAAGAVFGGAALLLSIPKIARRRALFFLTFTILLAGGLAVLIWNYSGAARRLFLEPWSEARVINLRIALNAFNSRPFFGWGPENYQAAFDRYYRPELLRTSFSETVADKPHNFFLETLATGGLALFAALLLFLAVGGYCLFKRNDEPLARAAVIGSSVAYFGALFFLFETLPAAILFFSLLAFIARAPSDAISFASKPIPARTNNLLWRWLLAAAAIGFAALAVIGGPAAVPASAATLAALNSRDAATWSAAARRAADAPSVHHPEIIKLLARDFVALEGRGAYPEEFFRDNVPWLRQKLEEITRRSPSDFTAQFMLGQLLTAEGQYFGRPEALNAALAAFERARDLSPRRQAVPLQAAKTLLIGDKNDEAIALLREIVAADPSLPEPHWFLGLALIANNELAAGAEEIRLTLRSRSPRNVSESLYIIDIFDKTGRYADIVPVLENLIRYNLGSAVWHARLAATYEKLGKPELAIMEAQRAAELDPSYRAEAEEFIQRLKP